MAKSLSSGKYFRSKRSFLSNCAVIDASTKSKQRDKDEKCVLSVKHDPQNEAPSHLDKKRFAESFIFPSFCTTSAHIHCVSILSISLAPTISSHKMKNYFAERSKRRRWRRDGISNNKALVHFFRSIKRTHSGHHHYQLNDFRSPFSLARVAGVLNFICFIWIIHTTTTNTTTCSVCYKMFMDERKKLKSVERLWKG